MALFLRKALSASGAPTYMSTVAEATTLTRSVCQ